ncbi:MAG TPA: hypothetical protein VHE13_08850 [Opitutus sp.]|nr:hypothetical protein [Opitutus sp.]
MKTPGDRDESAFNSPAEAGTRVVYLGSLLGMISGLLLLLVGLFTVRWVLIGAGVLLLATAAVGRRALRRNGQLAVLDRSLEEVSGRAPTRSAGEPQVEQLVLLLKQWDQLEHQRGSPEFDPWAVQALRHDIRAAIERNPALERLFHT